MTKPKALSFMFVKNSLLKGYLRVNPKELKHWQCMRESMEDELASMLEEVSSPVHNRFCPSFCVLNQRLLFWDSMGLSLFCLASIKKKKSKV